MVKFSLVLALFVSSYAQSQQAEDAVHSLGKRFFHDDRFSEYFFRKSLSEPNHVLKNGDPSLEVMGRTHRPIQGTAFEKKAVSCSSCHMTSEAALLPGGGLRVWTDFKTKSSVSVRRDEITQTSRNTPTLLNLMGRSETKDTFLRDGSEISLKKLIFKKLSSRELGWMEKEKIRSFRQIREVILEDEGRHESSKFTGGKSYLEWIKTLNENQKIDFEKSSDEEIAKWVSQVLTIYVESLALPRDSDDNISGSPYDLFLKKNQLPAKPNTHETREQYSDRLLREIEARRDWEWVTPADVVFQYTQTPFQFRELELEGMKRFFKRSTPESQAPNCIACHQAPLFTDGKLHSNGLVEWSYNKKHGDGEFQKYLFEDLKKKEKSESTSIIDLGFYSVLKQKWGVLLQIDPKSSFCLWLRICNHELITKKMIQSASAFKTPMLRGVFLSDPYMHDGSHESLRDVLRSYQELSLVSDPDQFASLDPALKNFILSDEDLNSIEAFMKSLSFENGLTESLGFEN